MDFATAMLNIARAHWPKDDWRVGDMRQLNLGDELFDGIIAWDSFFHLTSPKPSNVPACRVLPVT
jgi:ubiquinone/menaquinone biosynthesis C-methylase UbiE